PDFIFRAPIKLSKPVELREEYESQLRKLREEKLQEEKASEELLHKLTGDDMDVGKRKTEEQQKKEESVVLKVSQECCVLCVPLIPHPMEGAVPGERATLAFLFSSHIAALVLHAQHPEVFCLALQVLPVTGTSTPLVGVLSSTQNNRCLSAPDLTAEKRLVLGAVSSLLALHKPERSISPESNDSISEELNHFKPIVCSPCTPPKRLPDGRVLSPLIIKSTPRNLSRSLQKPTTYEASPRILKKWEQIFQERQIKKTLCKATLTSSASEPGEDVAVPEAANPSSCTKEQPAVQDEHLPPDTTGEPRTELDSFPSISQTKLGRGSEKSKGSQALTTGDGAAEADARSNAPSLNTRVSEGPDLKFTDKSCLKMVGRRLVGLSSTPGIPAAAPGKKQLKYLNNSELVKVQNSSCNSVGNILAEQPPPLLRRGRKRRCKTKHLEHNGSVKRLRHTAGEEAREREQKLQQEEEDRRLALHLQRIFDSENRTVDRRRVRVDRYLLRSKSTLGAK
ncbi:RN169 ligase, partial [Pitta sordida]|nr:RN169 ligase [Pitta sordida]